jgi:Tol biopolymer transport system component
MIKHLFMITILFNLLLSGCKDNNPINNNPPCGGINPDIVPEPPYDSPVWHPSGEFIGFNHTTLKSIEYPRGKECWGKQHFNRDSSGFWLINADGTNMRRIFPYKLQNPAWSPDGEWIAFNLPIGNEVHIFKMKFTGTEFDTISMVQLTTEGRNFFPAWSPDGQWIVYDSNNESPNGMNFIWRMKSDGSQKVRIVYAPSEGEIRMPSWSANGGKIAHIRFLIGVFSSEIFVMDNNDSSSLRLTFNGFDDRYPKYSSEVSNIAFWSNGNLWLMDSIGSNQQQLTTSGVDVSFGTPFSWSPEGEYIVYTVYRSDDWGYDNGTLWVLNLNTGEKKQLTFNVNSP